MTKKLKSKPRKEAIYATTAGAVSSIDLTIDARTGAIRFDTPVVNVYSQRSYERTKGPKVLSRVHQDSEFVYFDDTPTMFENFEFVVAVDTNTREISGQRISIVAVVPIRPLWIDGGKGLERVFKIVNPFCIEYINLKAAKPENFGWLAAYEIMLRQHVINQHGKLCMIVDSDLGNINEYNLRNSPVSESTYLPDKVQLVYASADAGAEAFVNGAIRTADSISTQTFSKMEDGTLSPNPDRVEADWFDGCRLISCLGENNNHR